MRLLLKILAVIAGLYSGFMAIASGLLFVTTVLECFDIDSRWQRMPLFVPIFIAACAAGFAILTAILTVRAYRHLRRPDRDSANDVFGIITFFAAMHALVFLSKATHVSKPRGHIDSLIFLGVFFAVFIGSMLFYRLALKRFVARTFSPDAV